MEPGNEGKGLDGGYEIDGESILEEFAVPGADPGAVAVAGEEEEAVLLDRDSELEEFDWIFCNLDKKLRFLLTG